MDRQKITINDVAKEANVSRATIDRVLYNRGYVSEDKKKAVLEAIKKFNFTPNKVAQALASHKNYTVAVVFPTAEKFFWDEVEAGIDAASREFETSGLKVVKFPIKKYDVEEQRQALEQLINRQIDALAVAPAHSSKLNGLLEAFIKKGIPVITFNSDAPKSGRLSYVGQDLLRSGSLAAELMALLLGGRGEVAVFRAIRDLLAIQQRVLGFTEKIEIDYPGIDIVGCLDFDESEEKAYLLTEEVINSHPDLRGIYVTNVYVNIVGRALKNLNLDKKISLVGFDMTDETKGYMKEGIIKAVINQEPYVQGYKPIQLLYKLLYKNEVPEDEIINTRLEIILPGNA